MVDDFETNEQALAGTVGADREADEPATETRTLGDDGTTLTGESDTSADASDRDLVEPAGE
jgi:hypothetical protein